VDAFRQRGKAPLVGMELTCCGSWGDDINIRGELQLLDRRSVRAWIPEVWTPHATVFMLGSLPHFQGIL
jgi:hypothetical protein